ncbi:MAG: cation-translocating P-type ATPase [Oscillospiraceae bacterium]
MNIFDILEKNPVRNKVAQDKFEKDEIKNTEKATNLISDEEKLFTGLSSQQAAQRLLENGKNELVHKKTIKPIAIFFGQFKDIMTLILLVCTGASVFMGEYVEALTIAVIVLMNGILGFIQEYKTEKTLEALKNMAAPMARVYRDNKIVQAPANEIVCEDVVVLEEGDKIPADGIVTEAVMLSCDESMLTGESKASKKQICTNLKQHKNELNQKDTVYMGCTVSQGRGKFIVKDIGMSTQMGHIANMLVGVKDELTPLQKKLAQLGKYIAVGCLLVCAIVTITGIIRGEPLFDMLITGISLAVAAVPEGLPAIVTISLALSVGRMVKRNALVRKLHSVETLGCAQVICSDKTGTLTQNKMKVTDIFVAQESFEATKTEINNEQKRLLFAAISCCNNAKIYKNQESFGDATEIALLDISLECNMLQSSLLEYERISEIPFDSTRKCMSVVCKTPRQEKIMFVKGAYDVIINKCNRIYDKNGVTKLFFSQKEKLDRENEKMAQNALRVIGVAYKQLSINDSAENEKDLIFLGLVGMMDPPRQEVKEAVNLCYKAGIKTVMITGDHKTTAKAIAQKVGIYHEGDLIITGKEIDSMSEQKLCEAAKKTTVFARVSPVNKLSIVKAFKKNGKVVAMTGDGVNDAPAIKEADIGVSMGISGTDVTKEASEIILLDDNFATLVNAVSEGRNIYNNIRKFIRYLLSCNIGEVITMFLGMLMGMPVILFPLQILLVNLVTDGLPAIALGLEPSTKEAMLKKPRQTNESIFSGGLAFTIIFRGVLIGLATLFTFVCLFMTSKSEEVARTGALVALIVAQLIHVFECKSEEKSIFHINYFDNMKLVFSVLLSLAILLTVVYYPPLQLLFRVVGLTLKEMLIPLFFSMVAPVINIFILKRKIKSDTKN